MVLEEGVEPCSGLHCLQLTDSYSGPSASKAWKDTSVVHQLYTSYFNGGGLPPRTRRMTRLPRHPPVQIDTRRLIPRTVALIPVAELFEIAEFDEGSIRGSVRDPKEVPCPAA